MKKLLLMGVTFTVLGAIPAVAQDTMYSKDSDNMLEGASYEEPSPSPYHTTSIPQQTVTEVTSIEPAGGEEDFTGPYIGGDIGYTIGTAEADDVISGLDADVGLDGMTYGLFAGYGFQQNFTPLLGGYAGIEVGYEWSEADGNAAATSFEKDGEWLVTFRPGVALGENALGYGVIGWSYASFDADGGVANGGDENFNGLVLGGGAEFSMGMPFRMRAEYNYTNYEDENLGDIDFEGHESTVKLGALLRF